VSDVLSSDVKNAAKRNDLSQGEVETMLKDTYEELKEKKPTGLRKLGIDEIAVVKGQKNYYVVLVDLDKKKVIEMIEDRKKDILKKYLEAWETRF
jgi:transposase